MASVTGDQVLVIIETDIDSSDFESTFIPMADALMSSSGIDAAGIDDAVDTQLRLLLSAHFAAVTRDHEAGSIIEHRSDTVVNRYAGGVGSRDMFGPGLKMTYYGQQAILLDPTGILATIADNKITAEIDIMDLPYPDPVWPEREL